MPSESKRQGGSPVHGGPPESGFVQEIGVFDATMLVAGSMIGSGIFIVSAPIGRAVGSPAWLLAVWALSGLMTILGALAYGELAASMPRAGGQYVFLRESWGPLVAFLYGWTFFLVIQTGTIAAVGVAFGKFLGVFVPALGEKAVVLETGLPAGCPFAAINSAQLVSVALIVLLTAVNLRGVRTGKLVQNVFTVTKVGSLLAVVAVGVWGALRLADPGNFGAGFFGGMAGFSGAASGTASGGLVSTAEASAATASAAVAFPVVLGASMVGALFSSDAWNNVTFVAAEVRDPRRSLPLSLALGTGLVVALYLAANVAYLLVLDFGDIASAPEDRVATAMLHAIFGPPGAMAMALGILVSTFGCNNGLILAGARVTYAMARDRLFFAGAGELNRAGVPGRALRWQAIVASVLALSGTYGKLLDLVIFSTLLFYVATVAGLFVLRRVRPDGDAPPGGAPLQGGRPPEVARPHRAFGYPFLPALYVVLAAGVAAALLVHPDTRGSSLWGLGIVLSGIPVHAWMSRRHARVSPPTNPGARNP